MVPWAHPTQTASWLSHFNTAYGYHQQINGSCNICSTRVHLCAACMWYESRICDVKWLMCLFINDNYITPIAAVAYYRWLLTSQICLFPWEHGPHLINTWFLGCIRIHLHIASRSVSHFGTDHGFDLRAAFMYCVHVLRPKKLCSFRRYWVTE